MHHPTRYEERHQSLDETGEAEMKIHSIHSIARTAIQVIS